VANLLLLAAGAAVAAAALRTPRRRRLALAAVRYWLGASAPVYLAMEVRRAWRETGP
jgi:hypothetical protein